MSDLRAEIAALFQELAELTLLDEANPQSFRVRAYENAVFEIKSIKGEIEELSVSALVAHRGIGKSSAKKIREYIETGRIAKLDELRAAYPPAYVKLSRVGGLGPKKLKKLRSELGVESIDDLKRAIEAKALRGLPGFGSKTEENLERALERLGHGDKKERRAALADALPVATRVVSALSELAEVARIEFCGSLRRMRETIGDVDIVVASLSPGPIMEAFIGMPEVEDVLAHGDTKSSIVTSDGLQIDLRVVGPEQYGAALLYFTGSKAHNIRLRQLAIDRGWTLNEYALKDASTDEVIASASEAAIYEALELQFVPPAMREDTGEVEAAADGTLPSLVVAEKLRGDLHVHTALSGDAKSSLSEILNEATARGYRYIAITDHGEDLAMSGVSRDGLKVQRREIEKLRASYPKLEILQGVELNIGSDGGLDYDADFRAELDFCIAGVHSAFDLDSGGQTARLIAAIEDPSVRVIAHLSGRLIGRRSGIDFDVEAVLRAAAATGTAIEINSGLLRLDASAEVARRARDLGVLFAVSSDAHHVDALSRIEWGARYAGRGWVDAERVVNTWPVAKFLKWARR